MNSTDDTLLTVIIPVYKTSATLDRCVESVASQTYRRLDIILVDDGSPDDCPQKCDRWAAADSRVRVVHKANGGLGDARNRGLDEARGGRVTFVDSDDFIAPGTYAALMDVLARHPDYDILEYGVARLGGKGREERLVFGDREYRSAADYWLGCRAYAHSYMWNKIFRRSLFDTVRHPPRTAFEDLYTLPPLLERARTVATTSAGLYCYCWNAAGITATAGAPELRALLDAHLRVIGRYRACAGFDSYYLHVLNIQLSVCAMGGDSPRLESRRVSLRACAGAVQTAKALALNALGLEAVCRLYRAAARLMPWLSRS